MDEDAGDWDAGGDCDGDAVLSDEMGNSSRGGARGLLCLVGDIAACSGLAAMVLSC